MNIHGGQGVIITKWYDGNDVQCKIDACSPDMERLLARIEKLEKLLEPLIKLTEDTTS